MKTLLFVFSFIIISFNISAQKTGSISGTITSSENGESLPGVEVSLIETSQGTVTSTEGKYIIKDVKPGDYTLKIHLLGYITKTTKVKVEADKNTLINSTLELDNIGLQGVTVSATKTKTTIDEIGSPVYIMDRKDIERSEGRNIDEVLIKVPGVFTEDRYHNETNVVSFRGVGLHTHVTRGILVLVDGVSLTEAMGRTDWEGVDLQNAEKVEVLKGPVSALYGPNGITGVINVVSRQPEEGIHGNIRADYGTYNSYNLSGDINGGKNGFRYIVKGKYYNTDGYQDRSGYNSARAGLKVSQQFKKAGKLQFSMDYIKSEMELPGTLDSTQFYNQENVSSNLFAGYDREFLRSDLVYTKSLGENIDLFANGYFRRKNSSGFYSDSRYAEDELNTYGGEFRSLFNNKLLGKKNSFIVGMSLLNESGLNSSYLRNDSSGVIGRMYSNGESNYNMLGAYVEDVFSVTKKLSITVGVRFDMVNYEWNNYLKDTTNTTDISSFSPKFGFAYNPNKNLTIFGNIARGFNPPQISQLFVGSSYSGLPNPDLDPEYLDNYELGVRGSIKKKLAYQVSFFMMDFTNQITTEIIPEVDPNTPVYVNIGKTRHMGVEAALEYHFNKQFNIYGNYSYLDARFNDDAEYNDNLLRKAPHNMFNTGIRYTFKFKLGIALDYKFVDKYYMDNQEVNEYEGYSTVNLKLMYRWKGFKMSLAVNNLLNSNYATWAYASEQYNYITHTTYWDKSYIPSWPINFNASVAYGF